MGVECPVEAPARLQVQPQPPDVPQFDPLRTMIPCALPPCEITTPPPIVEPPVSEAAIASTTPQPESMATPPAPPATPEVSLKPQWSGSPTQSVRTAAKEKEESPQAPADKTSVSLSEIETRLASEVPAPAAIAANPATTQAPIPPQNAPADVEPLPDAIAIRHTTPKLAPTAPLELPEHVLAQAETNPPADFDPVPGPQTSPLEIEPDTSEEAVDEADISEDDLGEILILQPRAPTSPRPPTAQLLVQGSAFASTNITGLETPSTGGYLLGSGATLLLTPPLGPSTRLVASAGAGLTRFPNTGSSNYDAFDFSVGIQQQLNPNMFGSIGWEHRRLYRAGSGEQLSSTHAANLTIGRQDQFSDRLRLDSFYRLRANFVSPDDFSRLTNSLGANLRYALSPQVEGLVGYQLSLEDYTRVARFDTNHRFRAGITYRPRPDLYVSGLASYVLGSSSDDTISADGLSVGLVFGFNLPLF